MLGIIGGTSLLDYSGSDFKKIKKHTPYGTSELFKGDGFYLLLRHQDQRAPHIIPFRSHLAALKLAGVDRVISIGSTGSLRENIPPGLHIIPDDYISQASVPTIFNHSIHHVNPVFDPTLRSHLESLCPGAVNGGTYIQTCGPRLESRSEIKAMAVYAHVVGMTIASELTLASEFSLPFAAICTIDNYANGICDEEISYESILATIQINQDKTLNLLDGIIGLSIY
ncbi:MAG: MTAP family purine nucleoside phosphorylase [Methanomicrobiales archaeon]|nr:MTAP family purine nucleoside phosphorylase [Methanomicrobiales archaeon]